MREGNEHKQKKMGKIIHWTQQKGERKKEPDKTAVGRGFTKWNQTLRGQRFMASKGKKRKLVEKERLTGKKKRARGKQVKMPTGGG